MRRRIDAILSRYVTYISAVINLINIENNHFEVVTNHFPTMELPSAISSTSIALIAALLAIAYGWVKWNYSYWERRGVPAMKPTFPFGNFGRLGNIHSHSDLMRDIYIEMKGKFPYCGLYSFHKPLALITDLELIKKVLTADFAHFHDRGIYYNAKSDPLSANLLSVEGQLWRDLRSKLTSTFTSGKIKMMIPLINDVAEQLRQTVQTMCAENDGIMEMKDLLASYTTDCIGVCGFGLECNSLSGPDVQFRVVGKKIFERPRNSPAKQLMISSFQNVARFFNARVVSEDVEQFYMDIVKKTVDYREKNNVHRNDLLDIMIALKNTGDPKKRISINQIVAEAFAFFLAGFGTTSTMMSFTVHELALNPDVQSKLREEIQQVLARHNGIVSYEATMEMTYLEMVFQGTKQKPLRRKAYI